MTKLLKPLGNGKKILTEKEVLEEINGIRALPKILVTPRANVGNSVKRRILKDEAAIGGAVNNHWFDYFKNSDEVKGQAFAAMPDYYHAVAYTTELFLQKLREDFRNPCIVTSTVLYRNGSIMHYEDTREEKLFPEFDSASRPYFQLKTIDYVLKEKNGVRFLQALFDTKDDGKMIKKRLEQLAGFDHQFNIKKIKINTPSYAHEIEDEGKLYTAIQTSYDETEFVIFCDILKNNFNGRARGIIVGEVK